MVKRRLKHNWTHALALLILAGILTSLAFGDPVPAEAYSLSAAGPDRKAVISISYTSYEWWLLTWSSSQVICQVYVEHEGWPVAEEVQYYCGDQVLKDWLATSGCVFTEQVTGAEQCPGLYLYLANVTPSQREIEVNLLPPEVFVDIANCNPQPPENRCETLPSLHLIGEEPLPNEAIINIQGYVGAEPFNCEGDDCIIPLPATGVDGIQAVFWAESSFGDASETYTAQIRVVPWGDFVAPDVQTSDQPQWYVDILSSQYLGKIESTCSQIWSAFPPVGGAPAWLASPDHPDGLVTNQPYYFLAGTLINQRLVDASNCPDGGLQTVQVASQCGLEAARDVISVWQNQFDSEIIQVSNETGVPSQLLKNVFSRESQFWPGFAASYKEAGLGHLSDLGADTVLLWNPSFFTQFCPLILDTAVCQRGFGNLDIGQQEMLRGALVQKVNAACPECPMGIDLRQAKFSISIFARSLLANCEQVGQIVYNTTRAPAGKVSFYEDLWRFTLVNYNAGPGCLTHAIQLAYANQEPLVWGHVIPYLEPGCQLSIDYVNDIAFMPAVVNNSPVIPTALPGVSTPAPTPNPTSAPTETPPIEPTPIPTDEGYPLPEPTDNSAYP